MCATKSPMAESKQWSEGDSKLSSSIPLREVIRVLSKRSGMGEGEEAKNKIKGELVGEFNSLDRNLDKIVRDNKDNFGKSVKCFISISGSVAQARGRVTEMRANIVKCKKALNVRKEKITQLWCSSVELTEMLRLLDSVEDVRKVPEQIKLLSSEKQYFVAAKLLYSTAYALNNELARFTALSDVKFQIDGLQMTLYETLVEELNDHLYSAPAAQSPAQPMGDDEESEVWEPERAQPVSAKAAAAQLMEKIVKLSLYTPAIDRYVNECIEPAPEGSSERLLSMLVEALRTMGKLECALEVIKLRLRRGVSTVAKEVRVEVVQGQQPQWRAESRAGTQKLGRKKEKNTIQIMLDLLFARLLETMSRHLCVLRCVRRATVGLSAEDLSDAGQGQYSEDDIWNVIETEVQETISDFLLPPNACIGDRLSSFKGQTVEFDIATLVTPRNLALEARVDTVTSKPLFTFAWSDFANSMDSRKGSLDAEQSERYRSLDLSYDPHPINTPLCYHPVVGFCHAVEECLPSVTLESNTLLKFLNDYVDQTYIDYLRTDMHSRLKLAAADPDAFLPRGNRMAKGTVEHQGCRLIKSVVVLEKLLDELQDIQSQLIGHEAQVVEIARDLLATYHSVCTDMYKAIMTGSQSDQGGEVGQVATSGVWVRHHSIVSLLRQYPTWLSLHTPRTNLALDEMPSTYDDDDGENQAKIAQKVHHEQLEVETQLLKSQPISKANIITQLSSISILANMHSSLEWLAGHQRFVDGAGRRKLSFVTVGGGGWLRPISSTTLPNDLVESLLGVYNKFQHLSDMCLLTLRMEVRCQCYYYLLTVLEKAVYKLEEDALQPDATVVKLNDSLCSLEDTVALVLPPPKIKFMFDQVSQLVCETLMGYVTLIKTINDKGVDKMVRNLVSLRQTLANIILCDSSDFERATSFYELLKLSMEDIVDQEVANNTPTSFTYDEYMRIFAVLRRQSTANERKYNDLAGLLKQITIGVAAEEEARTRQR